jgi:hypothetical protein
VEKLIIYLHVHHIDSPKFALLSEPKPVSLQINQQKEANLEEILISHSRNKKIPYKTKYFLTRRNQRTRNNAHVTWLAQPRAEQP